MSRIEIRTPSRLHFGLIEIKLGEPHCFGGLGMMLESPSFHLTIQSAKQFDASRTGDWEPRITKVAHHWASCRKRTSLPNVSIQILKELPPHAGLGSGTQLACGIVSLLDAAIWQRETEDDSNQSGSNRLTDLDRVSNSTPDIREWMQLVNRGARSKIGLAGFLHGGAIYDAGFSANSIPDGKPFHFEHIEIPDNWRAILVRPRLAETISGERETEFFVQCESIPNPNRSRMLQLLDQVILPAFRQGDLDLMSDSLLTMDAWPATFSESSARVIPNGRNRRSSRITSESRSSIGRAK